MIQNYFDEQPNDWFDRDVIAFMILSEDGVGLSSEGISKLL